MPSSNLGNRFRLLGIELDFVFTILLNSLKSEINLSVPLFLGMIEVEDANLEILIFFSTAIFY